MRRRPIAVAAVVAVAAFALLGAGCRGGAGSPSVASIDSSGTTTTSTTTQSNSRSTAKRLGAPGGGPRGQFQIQMNYGTRAGAKFSACMRTHGVPNFPDPDGEGVITIHSGMGIDPNSPKFISARATCSKLLPNDTATPAQLAERQQELLAFSTCMRAHGLKDFPDPTSDGIRITSGAGSDLQPNNPTFQRAQQACQGLLRFKTPSGTAKAGDG
jgi:hypothetical protein